MVLCGLPLKHTTLGALGLQVYGGLPSMAHIMLAGHVQRSVTGAKRAVSAIRYVWGTSLIV